ncbi:glutaredoxin, grx [Culex quinquefasciatus]|uniref:Glutaredoxin, grx n=1 Tax=Culex quinquefasciatus TaxID=7176 RepID=B0X997_CULQU|nr:glutaredoxin, grx [Culex quinquefasciatus]|eukprot:XP_001866219.1 glutaredoxin, grx [Culex quinquefasciatus]
MANTIVTSVDQYNKLISTPALTVMLFSADWAEQCKQILAVMTELARQFSAVQFVDVPVEELSEVALKQIDAVPTVIFFQAEEAFDRIDGVDIAALTTNCRKLAGAATSVGGGAKEPLEDRLPSDEPTYGCCESKGFLKATAEFRFFVVVVGDSSSLSRLFKLAALKGRLRKQLMKSRLFVVQRDNRCQLKKLVLNLPKRSQVQPTATRMESPHRPARLL